nr:hypothetical protein [Tanacetum cinerariifolium]
MDMTIDQQVALDEALVPHTSRLRIGKSSFRLRSDITSKESTPQDTATIHHHSIRFKMNNKKRIVNLEYFREMLHTCPRIPNQTFDELLFKEEILAFLRYLRHSGKIKKITDVNINKLHQPWRSFAAIINKCLSGKSTGYDSLRDDKMFTMIKLVSRHQNIQQFGAMLPVKLTNKDIRNSTVYKEYYAIASGVAPPKTKASVRKMQSSFKTTMPHLTVACTRLSTSAKGKQLAKSSKAKDEGTGIIPGVLNVPTDESDEEISWKSSDEDDDVDDQSGEEGPDAEDDDDELYRDVNINLEGRDIQMTDVHTTQVLEDTHVTLTLVNPDVQQQSS